MTTIRTDELRAGDVVAYDGCNRRIARVDRLDGWAWPVATDDTGWAIALGRQVVAVHQRAACASRG